jgi:hypothetical protein
VGLSQVQVEAESTSDVTSNGSFQLGGLFYQPFSEMALLRVGALVGQQNFSSTSTAAPSVETTISLTKLNVPVTMGMMMGERFMLFGGAVLGLTASKSCSITGASTCSVSTLKVAGSDFLLTLGTQFRLTSELAMELTFDKMGGKPFAGTTGGSAINVNFQYIIE